MPDPIEDLAKEGDLFFVRIRQERFKQVFRRSYSKGHDEMHSLRDWVAILVHEVGCLVKDAWADPTVDAVRDRACSALVKIAAVCLAAFVTIRAAQAAVADSECSRGVEAEGRERSRTGGEG